MHVKLLYKYTKEKIDQNASKKEITMNKTYSTNKQRILSVLSLFVLSASTTVMAKVPQIADSWTGRYSDQKISLFFKQKGETVTGYSLLSGKRTNFKGKIVPQQSNYRLTLTEQGQGASVGKFVLDYKNNGSDMDGQWISSQAKVKPRFFRLNAQQCGYSDEIGYFPIASKKPLTDEYLQVPLGQLQHMRNEIYARHGYAFQSKEWARTFAGYEAYMPCYTNVDNKLSKVEKENIRRIKLVEPYAEDVDWGR